MASCLTGAGRALSDVTLISLVQAPCVATRKNAPTQSRAQGKIMSCNARVSRRSLCKAAMAAASLPVVALANRLFAQSPHTLPAGIYLQRSRRVELEPQDDPPRWQDMRLRCVGDVNIVRLDPRTKETQPMFSLGQIQPLTARLSPDGQRLLFASVQDGRPLVHVRDLVTGSQASHAVSRREVLDCIWAPDSAHFAVRSMNDFGRFRTPFDVTLFHAKRQTSERIAIEQRRAILDTQELPAFSPDNARIAVCSTSGGVRIEPLTSSGSSGVASGTPAARPASKANRFFNPQWSPDGRTLLFVGEQQSGMHELYVASPSEAAEGNVAPVALHSERHTAFSRPWVNGAWEFPVPQAAAWAPDSRRIAYQINLPTEDDYAVRWAIFLHDLGRQRSVRLTHDERLVPSLAVSGQAIHWSPDGKQIAFMQLPPGMPKRSFLGGADPFGGTPPLEVWAVDVTSSDYPFIQLTKDFGDVVIAWH